MVLPILQRKRILVQVEVGEYNYEVNETSDVGSTLNAVKQGTTGTIV